MENDPLTVELVVAKDGGFETHPESMTPRVFVTVLGESNPETPWKWIVVAKTYDNKAVTVFELLRDGKAVIWPHLPPAEPGFDFWHITLMGGPSNMTLVRNKPEIVAAPHIPAEVWDALKDAGLKINPETGDTEKIS